MIDGICLSLEGRNMPSGKRVLGALFGASGVEGISHTLADEDQEREHNGECAECRQAQPRRLDVSFALR